MAKCRRGSRGTGRRRAWGHGCDSSADTTTGSRQQALLRCKTMTPWTRHYRWDVILGTCGVHCCVLRSASNVIQRGREPPSHQSKSHKLAVHASIFSTKHSATGAPTSVSATCIIVAYSSAKLRIASVVLHCLLNGDSSLNTLPSSTMPICTTAEKTG